MGDILVRNIGKFSQSTIKKTLNRHLNTNVEIITKESEIFETLKIDNEDFLLQEKDFIMPFKKDGCIFFFMKMENQGFDSILFVKKINDIWNNFLYPLQTINEIKIFKQLFDTMSKKILLVFNKSFELIYLNKEIHRNVRQLFNFPSKKVDSCVYKMNEIFETQLDLLKAIKVAIDKATKEGKPDISLEGEYSEWKVFLNFDLAKNLSKVVLLYDWENKATA